MHERVGNYVFRMTLVFMVITLFSHAVIGSMCFIVPMNEVPNVRCDISNVAEDSIDLAKKASHILVGRVENIESRWGKETSSIYTYVELYVEERLKGTTQDDHVVIKHKGGDVGDIGLRISDEPCFRLNEEVEVFLKLEETGEFTVLEGRKGKVSLISPASSGFSHSGIHWDQNDLPVPYHINENCTPAEVQAVQASFQTWENDPESFMDYTHVGATTLSNASLDGYNVISWQPIDGPGGTLAQTTSWYSLSTQLMIEFDMVFDEDETWSTTGEPNKYDVQNLGTHEVGHTLVLEDLYDLADSEQTMYGYSSLGETKKRTLEAGDLAGIRYIYPVTQTPKTVYTITTSPLGLLIEVDGAAYTSPHPFEWTPNSTHTIYVPSTQSRSFGTRYIFVGWSDGGTQQHQIMVGTSNVTITATYISQHFMTIETQGLGSAYPAMVKFTQLGVSKTSSTYDSWSNWCDSGSTLTIASYVGGQEGQRWITHNTTSWTVNSALTATVRYVLQYQVSMAFKTYDQVLTLQPTQVQIIGGSPNNTLLTLRSYSTIWLDNVTWTLKQVLWRNSNVITLNSPSVNLVLKYQWTIICRVYPTSFDAAFKNFKGLQLSENPSSFRLQFPNETESDQLNPSTVYYIQNGTTRWKSIIWRGVEVVPPDAYFDATDGNPKVNCLIYDFVVKVSDLLGLPVAGAQVSAKLSNGRTVNTQTGPDGLAVIRMVPKGGFTVFVSYLAETTSISGDVAEAASTSVEVKLTFGLSVLVLLSLACALAVIIAVLFWLRMSKSRRV